MRNILVTGANKGIGLAIVEATLEEHDDTFVFLGSRDEGRGQRALDGLVARHGAWRQRLELVVLDVADDDSVRAAAARVRARLSGGTLYGLVNNAGIGAGAGDLATILEVNAVGVHRVCEAFVPLLAPRAGRIVNVTSAAGPSFVATCSPERQRFLAHDALTWPRLRAFIDECVALARAGASFAEAGLGTGNAYGLSKACANAYTRLLASEHPDLHVNACTPGFIATDLTRPYLASSGKSADELGMKPPSAGAKAPMHLLFGQLEGNGRYYGSDARRSPLDRYREPGTPPYEGP